MNLTGPDILAELQKIHEAYCVLHAIPCEREYADDDLAPTVGGLVLIGAKLDVLQAVQP